MLEDRPFATKKTVEEKVKSEKVEEKKKEETKSVTIDIEPIKFDPNIESCFMNTVEISELIDEVFSGIFKDYAGCKILLNDGKDPVVFNDIPYGALYVSIYFKPNAGNGQVVAIKSRSIGRGNSRYESLMRMSGNSSGRMYEVEPETYEVLEEFRFRTGRKTNWNMLTSETLTTFGYSMNYNQEVVVRVAGLSLEQILNRIYGTEENGKKFQYQAVPVQFVANYTNSEYLVQITKLDIHKLNDLRRSIGGPVQNMDFHQYVK